MKKIIVGAALLMVAAFVAWAQVSGALAQLSGEYSSGSGTGVEAHESNIVVNIYTDRYYFKRDGIEVVDGLFLIPELNDNGKQFLVLRVLDDGEIEYGFTKMFPATKVSDE